MKAPPIFVVGTGRSGTSTTARVLHERGFLMGGKRLRTAPSHACPDGCYEDLEVRHLNACLLRGEILPRSAIHLARQTAELLDRKSDRGRWGLKCPMFAFTLGTWLHAIDEPPRIVWCRRNLDLVARSRFNMLRSETLSQARDYVAVANRSLERILANLPQEQVVEIWFDEFLEDDEVAAGINHTGFLE